MVRPVAFKRRQELRAFLVSRAPRHVYFSTAYYRDPQVPMAEKEWQGADLIFDLDADHIPGAEKMNYKEMLEKVKEEFKKLLDQYIMGDMGFGEEDLAIVFSGGRGYHVHVRNPKVFGLGSQERREIVDYVTGKGLDRDILLNSEMVVLDERGYMGKPKVKQSRRLYPRSEPGWRGKMTWAMMLLGQRLKGEVEEGREKGIVKEIMTYPGVGRTTAGKVVQGLQGPWKDHPARLDALIQGDPNILDSWEDERVTNAFLEMVVREMAVVGGETDEPVTSDIKRLIRFPASIHGKSSFRVVPLTRGSLDDFDPFKDAIVFGDEPVEVEVSREMTCFVGGEKAFGKGPHEVSEAIAMHLLCSGAGEIGGSEE